MTTIFGASNVGKSAVLRALWSLLFREKFYLRNGESSGSIKIETESGNLSRSKTVKGINVSEKFILNGTAFRKIGKELPQEILEFTKVKPIDIGEGDKLLLNRQTQHEGKFMLSDSSYSDSFRARVTSLQASETLDKASREAAKETREVRSSLKHATESELHDAEESLSKLEGIPELVQGYKSATKLNNSITKTKFDLESLRRIRDGLKPTRKPKDFQILILGIEQVIHALNGLALSKRIQDTGEPFVKPILPSGYQFDSDVILLELMRRMRTRYQKANEAWKEWQRSESELRRNQIELSQLTEQIKTCPTCGSIMVKNHGH